jgi:hypothetical protein
MSRPYLRMIPWPLVQTRLGRKSMKVVQLEKDFFGFLTKCVHHGPKCSAIRPSRRLCREFEHPFWSSKRCRGPCWSKLCVATRVLTSALPAAFHIFPRQHTTDNWKVPRKVGPTGLAEGNKCAAWMRGGTFFGEPTTRATEDVNKHERVIIMTR